MQFELDDTQRALAARFAELGRSVAARAASHDAAGTLDRSAWQAVADAGLWRLPVAREDGGAGGSWIDCVAAIEGIAGTVDDLGFMITMLGHIGSLRLLVEEGTPAQKARWLEPLMRGEIGVTAMTEAGGGSDLARMRLSAEPNGEGAWLLSGAKTHITNAPVARHGMIAGRVPSLGKGRDITLFFVDLDADGVMIGDTEDNLGIRTSPTADIVFDDTPLTEENIVGRPGDGLRLLYRVIAFERALYGVIASGMIEGMIDKAMDRVESRTAFGRPLADYQYVQSRITDMKMAAVACRLATYSGLSKLEADVEDASIVCSTAKFLAGEQLLASAEHLVQLHGHLGFMNNDISRALRDAVGMRIAGGTSDIQRINVFNQMRRMRSAARNPVLAAAE